MASLTAESRKVCLQSDWKERLDAAVWKRQPNGFPGICLAGRMGGRTIL